MAGMGLEGIGEVDKEAGVMVDGLASSHNDVNMAAEVVSIYIPEFKR